MEKINGRKYIRKLILGIMELLIFNLLKVQANDFAPTSFHPSSLPIMLLDFSKVDKVLGVMERCLKSKN
jgi:hypothetical protein